MIFCTISFKPLSILPIMSWKIGYLFSLVQTTELSILLPDIKLNRCLQVTPRDAWGWGYWGGVITVIFIWCIRVSWKKTFPLPKMLFNYALIIIGRFMVISGMYMWCYILSWPRQQTSLHTAIIQVITGINSVTNLVGGGRVWLLEVRPEIQSSSLSCERNGNLYARYLY